MNTFVNFNANPKNKLGCDCVVRAISTAMREDWITVYRELCDLGAELYDMPFNKDVFGEYLKRKGWIWHPCKSENGKRPKVCNFDKANSAILRVANHLVYVSNHEYYDTWDCGSKSVYGYWAKLN